MKLYYAPQACSLAPHIVLRELGLPFELIRIDNRSKQTDSGEDFFAINPKGYVAALQLDDAQVLTEGPAILQYLADLRPDTRLAPAPGTFERVRLQEWLNFVSTEIHGGLGWLFSERFNPGRESADQGEAVQALCGVVPDAGAPGLSADERLQRCRRVPVHGAALGAVV